MQRRKHSVERTMPHIIALTPKWSGNLGNLTPRGFVCLLRLLELKKKVKPECSKKKEVLAQA